MTQNENAIDRLLRLALGVVLLALVFVGPKTPWGLIGLVPLATGALGFCPLYRLIGVSTCSSKRVHLTTTHVQWTDDLSRGDA